MPEGAMKESGLSSTDAYLTRKAGMYCDVVERLAKNHLEVSPRFICLHRDVAVNGSDGPGLTVSVASPGR